MVKSTEGSKLVADANPTNGTDDRGREPTVSQGGKTRRDKNVSREALGVEVAQLRENMEQVEHTTKLLEGHLLGELEEVKKYVVDTDARYIQLEDMVNALQVSNESIIAKLEGLEADMRLCRRAASEGITVTQTGAGRVDFPRPSKFNGARDAKEGENFLWQMEQYFDNINLTEELAKIKAATSYLVDTAMLWWRRKHADIGRGAVRIETWEEFKRELKRQFYPENVVYEARKKLRELR